MLNNSFFWVSFDPHSKKPMPYDQQSSRHLEAAFRNKMTDVTLLLDVEEVGFIANVQLDLVEGQHVQRSANGTGERSVRRAESTTITFEGVTHNLQEDWACSFQRVTWVHLDPVTGVASPYTKENAALAEAALRRKDSWCPIVIQLGDSKTIAASIRIDFNMQHSQTTVSGFREVRRIILPTGASQACIDVYRLPEEGTIDSERYRFSATKAQMYTATFNVSLGCFFEEEALPLVMFASLADLDRGLKQLRYPEKDMLGLARLLKNGPFVDACRLLSAAYTSEPTALLPLSMHLMNVVQKWTQDGYMVQMQPTQNLLDDLENAQTQFLVTSVDSRSFTSNGLKVAAAAAFLLMNPDAAL
jgi:hypothetical protein